MLHFSVVTRCSIYSRYIELSLQDNLLTEIPLRKFPLSSVYVTEHIKQRYAKLISNDEQIYL
jgi:hypothetical protein